MYYKLTHKHSGHHNFQQGDEREARIRSIVEKCNYNYDSTEVIIQCCLHVLTTYDSMDCETIEFVEYGQQKRFIEIRGKLAVNYKGSNYFVRTCVMLPQGFPHQPPCVRIINDDTVHQEADPFYASMQSPNDPHSFVIMNLQSVHNWGQYGINLLQIYKELSTVLGNRFPFKVKKAGSSGSGMNSFGNTSQKTMNSFGNTSQKTMNAFGNVVVNEDAYKNNAYPGSNAGFVPQPGFSYTPTNAPQGFGGFNPVYNTKQSSSSNSSGGFNTGYNTGFGNAGFGNAGFSNVGFQPASFQSANNPQNTGMSDAKLMEEQQKTAQNIEKLNKIRQTIKDRVEKGKSFATYIQTAIDNLKMRHTDYFIKSGNFSIINCLLDNELQMLKQDNQIMLKLIKENENKGYDINVNEVITPADEMSQALIDYVSSAKAWEQSASFIESKFVNGEIKFDQFMKSMRKIEEQRFMSREMVRRCIKNH